MNTQNPNDELNFLRSFSADAPSSLNETTTIRAEARLEQILASPPESSVESDRNHRFGFGANRRFSFGTARNPKARAHSRSNPLRWVAIPVAAAAVIAAGVIWPHNPINPAPALTAHAALATWQPAPAELSADLLNLADAQCRDGLTQAATDLIAGLEELETNITTWAASWAERQPNDPTVGDLIIAEQRGDWGFLAYAAEVPVANQSGQPDQQVTNTASCLVWFPANAPGRALVMSSSFETGGAGSLMSWDASGDGTIVRPSPMMHWSYSPAMHDAGGNELERLRQSGASFDDGTAFQAVIGNLGSATDVAIQAGNLTVTPTVSGDWFAAWWPVERDMSLLAARFQCQDEWDELGSLDTVAANQNWWCGFWGSEFTPQIDAITLTAASGAAVTYRPESIAAGQQALTAAVDAARAARAQAELEAAARGEVLPPVRAPRPNTSYIIRNNPAETGIDIQQLFLADEQLALPAYTTTGWPITWAIDPFNNPNGAEIIDGVLHVGQPYLSANSPHALRLVASITVGDRTVPVGFTVHVVDQNFLLHFGGERMQAMTEAGEVLRLQRAIAAASNR